MRLHMKDATATYKAVWRESYNVPAVKQSAYLGVAFGCGRHARATRTKRESRHLNISKNIKRFSTAFVNTQLYASCRNRRGVSPQACMAIKYIAFRAQPHDLPP